MGIAVCIGVGAACEPCGCLVGRRAMGAPRKSHTCSLERVSDRYTSRALN
jgi:hypothetical protein